MKNLLKLILATLTLLATNQAVANDDFESTLNNWVSSESEEILGCITSYVGPAAPERASCNASVHLVDNDGRTINFYSASATISGRSSGSSCCSNAISEAMNRCRSAYSSSQRAGRCIENFCNCTQYVRQM